MGCQVARGWHCLAGGLSGGQGSPEGPGPAPWPLFPSVWPQLTGTFFGIPVAGLRRTCFSPESVGPSGEGSWLSRPPPPVANSRSLEGSGGGRSLGLGPGWGAGCLLPLPTVLLRPARGRRQLLAREEQVT